MMTLDELLELTTSKPHVLAWCCSCMIQRTLIVNICELFDINTLLTMITFSTPYPS